MNEFDDEDISRSSACFFLDLRCPLKAVGRMARSAGRGNPANICFRFQIPPTARILPLLNGKLKGKASTIFNLQPIHKKLQDACCQRNMCQKIVEAQLERNEQGGPLPSYGQKLCRIFGKTSRKKAAVLLDFVQTRSYAALRAADLDWIVRPGYSLGRVHSGEKP